MTCETVPIETSARSAICRIVTGTLISNHDDQSSRLLEARRARVPALHPQRESFTHEPNSVRILSAPKTYPPGTIHAGSHHQEFAVLVEFVGLREVPDRPLGLVIASAAKNPAASVVILELLCPLP